MALRRGTAVAPPWGLVGWGEKTFPACRLSLKIMRIPTMSNSLCYNDVVIAAGGAFPGRSFFRFEMGDFLSSTDGCTALWKGSRSFKYPLAPIFFLHFYLSSKCLDYCVWPGGTSLIDGDSY